MWIKRPNLSRLNSVIRSGVWLSRSAESGAASFLGTGCPPSCAISLAARGGVAEFTLLDQFVAGVVAVAGELMVEAAFGNQAVEDVVGKAVARTVFIGEAD